MAINNGFDTFFGEPKVVYTVGLIRIISVQDHYVVQGGWDESWIDISLPVKELETGRIIADAYSADGQ